VLVIEDGQWLDPLSHDLLEAIGRAIADMPVLILFAYRPPELEHLRAPRVTGLLHTTVIELHDLSAVEAAELVALKQIHLDMPAELPPDVVDRIVARTQGNPFYIEELISYLFTLGLAPQSVAELDRLDLPTSLASLILGRIDQLSESQKTTLKVASVIGRLFRAGWLWGFYPGLGEPARIRADLDVLNRLDLTPLDQPEPELTYLFKHILTHGVAYESLPFATRSWLHGELARFIEQQYGGILEQFIDLLAYHYDISGIEEKRREYLYKAGMAAQAAYANAAAIDYYRRLLPLLDAEEKVPVLLQLGQVLELTGQWSEVAALYRQALTLSEGQHNAQLRAQARNALGNLYSRRGEYNEASTALEEAQHDFVLAGDKAGVGQTLHYRGALEMRRGDLDAARALWEISLEMRRELGDESNVATLLSNLGIVAHYQGDYDGAITMYQRSLFISRRIGARLVTARALNNYGLVAREQNDFVTARELFDESLNLRREIGDRWGIANGLNNLGQIARELGDLATAETMFEESMAINREIGDKGALVYLLEDFGFLAARQQEPERALILLAAAAAQREATGASRSSAEQQRFEQIRAELEAALGPNADPAWQRGHTMSLDEAIAYASPINSLKSP
jgi:tetratricopeptide (TPR) repeat protein